MKDVTSQLRVHASRQQARRLRSTLDGIDRALSTHIAFQSPAHSRLLALWVGHCHAIDAAYASPIVHIFSPTPGAGKTTLLEILVQLLPEGRAILDVSMSGAALYRTLGTDEQDMPSPYIPLLDEIDGVFRRGNERGDALRTILNAGYRRGGTATKCVAPDWKPVSFFVFGPRLLCGLDDGLPATIRSRCLPVPLRTALPEERVERFRHRRHASELNELRDELAAALLPLMGKLAAAEPDGLDDLDMRQQEIIEPLVAIADVAGGLWPQRAREGAAEAFENRGAVETTTSTKLLGDVRRGFQIKKADRLFSDTLCEILNTDAENSYARWNGSVGISPRDLARRLAPFQIAPRNVRIGDEQRKGYLKTDFADAWQRYGSKKPEHPLPLSQPSVTRTGDSKARAGGRDRPKGTRAKTKALHISNAKKRS